MKRTACLFLILASTGCEKPQTLPIQSSEIAVETRTKAIAAKEDLFKQLSSRLMEVIQSEGPEAAIEVCSNEVVEIGEAVGTSHGVRIGRTALRLRNPENIAPDWTVGLLSQDATDPQFVTIDNNTTGAVMPIKLKTNCLICHGPQDTLSASVKQKLSKFYPNDTATGFQEGDLRGWFWIEIPEVPQNNANN